MPKGDTEKTSSKPINPDKQLSNVYLNGFDIDKIETDRINGIISHYAGKIERNCRTERLKLTLKKSMHGKAFLHEIKCIAETKQGVLNAVETDYNIFRAVSKCLEKVLHETEHMIRTNRQNIR